MPFQQLDVSRLPPDTRFPTGFCSFTVDGLPPDEGLWLALEGQAVSRTGIYAKLFARWGTSFGVGNGTTTFNVRDMRGVFPRGVDNGRGIDAGRTVGSQQAESIGPHAHPASGSMAANARFGAYGSGGVEADFGSGDSVKGYTSRGISVSVSNNSGTENRPINVAVIFWVKL